MKHFKKLFAVLIAVLTALSLASCTNNTDLQTPIHNDIPAADEPAEQPDMIKELELSSDVKDATLYTAQINSTVYDMLDFENTQEWDFATRNLIDAPKELELTDDNGNVIWSQAAYSFLEDYEEAPDTVNPSLWENTK